MNVVVTPGFDGWKQGADHSYQSQIHLHGTAVWPVWPSLPRVVRWHPRRQLQSLRFLPGEVANKPQQTRSTRTCEAARWSKDKLLNALIQVNAACAVWIHSPGNALKSHNGVKWTYSYNISMQFKSYFLFQSWQLDKKSTINQKMTCFCSNSVSPVKAKSISLILCLTCAFG